MTEEIEDKKLVSYTVRLDAFGISAPIYINATSLREAYSIAVEKIVDGILYVPPSIPSDIEEKLSYVSDQVFKHTGMNIQKLRSPIRSDELTHARHAFCWLAKNLYNIKPAYITSYINRDRSTCYNSVEQVDNSLFYPFNNTYTWVKSIPKKEEYAEQV